MQCPVLHVHRAGLWAGWRQRYLQPLKNVFCSFNSSSWGGGGGGLYHVSFSRCWIKNSTLSHLLQAARKPPATPSTRPTNRPAPAYPRPPYTRVSSPLQQLCLSEACSTDWIHLAAAARAFSRSAITAFDPKTHCFSITCQEFWVRAVEFEMPAWNVAAGPGWTQGSTAAWSKSTKSIDPSSPFSGNTSVTLRVGRGKGVCQQ